MKRSSVQLLKPHPVLPQSRKYANWYTYTSGQEITWVQYARILLIRDRTHFCKAMWNLSAKWWNVCVFVQLSTSRNLKLRQPHAGCGPQYGRPHDTHIHVEIRYLARSPILRQSRCRSHNWTQTWSRFGLSYYSLRLGARCFYPTLLSLNNGYTVITDPTVRCVCVSHPLQLSHSLAENPNHSAFVPFGNEGELYLVFIIVVNLWVYERTAKFWSKHNQFSPTPYPCDYYSRRTDGLA